VPDTQFETTLMQATPFLKWAGGKRSLLKQYDSLFPANGSRPFRAYYEPFVGSGAVFFHLRGEGFARDYVLADINHSLINIYRVVQQCVDVLIDHLKDHRAKHSQGYYYFVREWDRQDGWPENKDPVERAARMIYLNRTCYNGLWRVNSRGEFNVPMGRYNRPRILDRKKLRAAAEALAGVELRPSSFEEAVDGAGSGDFVYLDPPYMPLNETSSFTSYAAGGFGREDQARLAATFRDLDRRGCTLMLSNSDHPTIRELYEGFDIQTVKARRYINSQPDGRGPITELVIRNYDG
jgi:DNA adenine methylase